MEDFHSQTISIYLRENDEGSFFSFYKFKISP